MRSDNAWLAAHRAGWPMTLVSSLLFIAMGVRILVTSVEEIESEVWWFMGPLLVALLVATVQAHVAAKKAYEEDDQHT